ncbi:endonuclease/exonuclease/phosphatase family protein [Ensifer sp. ENS11]|uniref:endonuclease/exonuclease/phosphatase family protein n=1 Tax=Ensifer sp. ENS11 TaxID=2769291 RepID=UPI00178701B9|nr:endonuclease/exonuclease/phosphatase family protein [Ensifer sp. ENS11]MBD9488743.1 hypothetical protein [Ensifer sp. ENS11]
MFRAIAVIGLMCLPNAAFAQSGAFRIGSWNITNLHHETGVPLRGDAKARDDIDYARLKDFAASLSLDIVALQEIGSPKALSRVFPSDQYHLILSKDYVDGAENQPADQRDIYTAFALRKSVFPSVPDIRTLEALHIVHLEVDRDGKASDRPVRSGLILPLTIGGKQIEVLNVHLKSSCNASSLSPIFDERQDGSVNPSRYDCRTLLAQTAILENWLEQRQELGIQTIVLGDFNRQLNREGATDHMWQMLNDGTPEGLGFVKAPTEPNTVCWPSPHAAFFPNSIDFITYDQSLLPRLDPTTIKKVGIPFADDARYAGDDNQKLSDHCPTVGVLNAN